MDCLRVNANFTGCVVDLATWMDLCYRVWQLWRQKINRITRSFMKADLAGKTGEHTAGQVLSRSGRYRQWLYLGCSKMPLHQQQSASVLLTTAHSSQLYVLAVRCLEAQVIIRCLVHEQSMSTLLAHDKETEERPTMHSLRKRVERWSHDISICNCFICNYMCSRSNIIKCNCNNMELDFSLWWPEISYSISAITHFPIPPSL